MADQPVSTRYEFAAAADDLRVRLVFLLAALVSVLIDGAFLALWALAQWALESFVLARLGLTELDAWVLMAFRLVFAVSTLVPVLVYVYVDLRTLWLRLMHKYRLDAHLVGQDSLTSPSESQSSATKKLKPDPVDDYLPRN